MSKRADEVEGWKRVMPHDASNPSPFITVTVLFQSLLWALSTGANTTDIGLSRSDTTTGYTIYDPERPRLSPTPQRAQRPLLSDSQHLMVPIDTSLSSRALPSFKLLPSRAHVLHDAARVSGVRVRDIPPCAQFPLALALVREHDFELRSGAAHYRARRSQHKHPFLLPPLALKPPLGPRPWRRLPPSLPPSFLPSCKPPRTPVIDSTARSLRRANQCNVHPPDRRTTNSARNLIIFPISSLPSPSPYPLALAPSPRPRPALARLASRFARVV
ncbi:hypothetical protein C8F04DRAFT_1257476 [Mycena alexandri]|uniref:Uncharacterized protein n=1 Tax=Mycena alexandri TaxID=1745969 RepID=A0AAD6SZH4_9AGAR|nr:hypothetical protein C8F04DRAFT_1257476 [Mycena alexandri]